MPEEIPEPVRRRAARHEFARAIGVAIEDALAQGGAVAELVYVLRADADLLIRFVVASDEPPSPRDS